MFEAWLSTSVTAAVDRLTRSATTPYALADDPLVTANFDDLLDGALEAPINQDAEGHVQTGDVWTGTLASGQPAPGEDCEGFTTSTPDSTAQRGSSQRRDPRWTESSTPQRWLALRVDRVEQP